MNGEKEVSRRRWSHLPVEDYPFWAQARAHRLKVKAELAKGEVAELEASVRRAQVPLLDPTYCDDCWVALGELNELITATLAGSATLVRCLRGHEKVKFEDSAPPILHLAFESVGQAIARCGRKHGVSIF